MTTQGTFEHISVLLAEFGDLVAPVGAAATRRAPRTLIDASVGGGGHAEAALEQHPHLHLLGIDQDAEAIEAASQRLARFGERVELVRSRSDQLAAIVADRRPELPSIGAFLQDLGVSSHQLDVADRGFSHRNDGPLDMRMDASAPIATAADLVNGLSEGELRTLLEIYGGERHAGRIARAIVASRPIYTTGELATVTRDAIPAAARRSGRHPARKTFSALRTVVNDEVGAFEATLDAAIELVEPGGRVMVITFESLTDRIAKHRFRQETKGDCICPPHLPCMCGAAPRATDLARGGITPSEAELEANPRSASARLRAIEKHRETTEAKP